MQDFIVIRGAKVHNLKDLSVSIPHNVLTVVTGVSGSGKSSLVFDTIYAEGQRRYVESLSAYARQFLDRMEKPDVEEIDGIAPPVAIRQKNTTRNPRSTVATATELYDFMRLLWARAGETWCPACSVRVRPDTVDHVAAEMLGQPAGSRWYALFPIPRQAKTGELRDQLFELRKKGFNRLYQAGRTFEFSTPESLLEVDFQQDLFALVDRIALPSGDSARAALHQRLVDTTEICYREGGEAIFEDAAGGARLRFSEKFDCKRCGASFTTPEPSLFSFNSPFGACPRCQGFGNTVDYDRDLILPDPYLSLNDRAVACWNSPQYESNYDELRAATRGRLRFNVPFADLSPAEQALVWKQVDGFFAWLETKKYKVHVRVFLSRYRGFSECHACGGARLRPEALNVRLAGRTLADAVRDSVAAACGFFETLELGDEQRAIAGKVLVEIRQRLQFLRDVGLGYLTLDRLSATLSGGEAQRIQLATCLGSRLVGACYVLDEPSIGLHPRDTHRLIAILHELRDLGNTIIVVEHDADVMRASDHILDLGPGAGENGGRVVYQGSYRAMLNGKASTLTTRYLRGELATSSRRRPRPVNPRRVLRFTGCHAHNIRNIDVEIPLDMMVAVTGVSGSGKSTLIHEVVHRSLERETRHRAIQRAQGGDPAASIRSRPDRTLSTNAAAAEKQTCRAVDGASLLDAVVLVDQSPIGRTPRSNPITYIKAFDVVRELFASTTEADRRGYGAGHFSFNIPGGRCETCQGDGRVSVEMQFLADVELVCEECRGTRFKSGILEVRYQGLNIHEVLQLTVEEALQFFANQPRLSARLRVLAEVGLGYLRLGQSATTLSGGEAQRVKLAAHLGQSSSAGTLFIFDEPTTGLHFDDIARLLDAFQRLIAAGGSVLIIEHNLDVIRAADWIIDLGPEGGDEGGRIVVTGPPEKVACCAESHTGRFLREAGLSAS